MSQNINDFLSDSMKQWVLDYWSALYNPVQTQQPSVGQQLAAGPTTQQPQAQMQQVQQPQQQQTQQQSPASVRQGQTISQPQSNVGMVQKVDTAPASINTDPFAINADEINPGGAIGQGSPSGISYQGPGHFEPVYDEVGQVVQNNWISDIPTRLSDADTSEIVTTGTGHKISRAALEQQMYGKQVGDYNLNLPQIEQGGLDQQTIDALGKFQNNPNFYGGVFDPSKWEEGPAFYNPGVREVVDDLGGKMAQGGDPTNYAGQMEYLRDQAHLSMRNKETGEVIPYYQLFREFPQQAADINTKIAEYARSKPWWKEDLAPDVIKGISAAIAAAGGAAIGGALAGTGAAAGGAAGGAAGTAAGVTIPEAVGAGLGSAAATNATMEGDIGDRLLPTAISFAAGAAAPYVTNYLGQGWNAVKDYFPSLGGGDAEGAISGTLSGAEESVPGLNPEWGVEETGISNWNDPAGSGGVPSASDLNQLEWHQMVGDRTAGYYNPEGVYNSLYSANLPAENAFMADPTLSNIQSTGMESTKFPFELREYADPTYPADIQHGIYNENLYRPEMQSTFTADPTLELGPRAGLNDVRFADQLAQWSDTGYPVREAPIFQTDPTLDYPDIKTGLDDPRFPYELREWADPRFPAAYEGESTWSLGDIPWGRLVSAIPAISALANLLSKPSGTEGGGGGSVHAGGGAEAMPDFSELAGLLARGAGGGGETGPSAGSAKGGGFGEGGMLALMNLVLNEMQKGGKYYFQT